MLKYCDFVKKYLLLKEGGTESGPHPKDCGKSDDTTDTEKQKTDGEKEETTQNTDTPKTTNFYNKRIGDKIKGNKHKDDILKGKFDNKNNYEINKDKSEPIKKQNR